MPRLVIACRLACSCLLWVPIDVVKERMQIQRVPKLGQAGTDALAAGAPRVYRNSWDALVTIVRSEGIRSVYKARVP
jgi:hypothetical protein